jgi:pimeloyl-ACP methyl ester carboxylesterase
MEHRSIGILAVVLGLSAVALRSSSVSAAPDAPPLSPCHLEHLAEEVRCGSHEVFENRAAGSGRRIKIRFAVLPPLRRAKEADPLFIMAGGPGQGARSYASIAARYFKKVRRTREIVLVDLRGTGGSNRLGCAVDASDEASLTSLLGDREMATRCLETLDADPRHYTHADALADLDEIRQRLGYERINLWGGSWGTRAALLYAATYPKAVRSVVLDGAVPLDMEFPRSVAFDSEAAMQLVFDDCLKDESCARAFPNARADFMRLLERLERTPVTTTLIHPRTGKPVGATLTRGAVVEIVRVALYTPGDASRLLRVLSHASAGNYQPLFAQRIRSASALSDDMALGTTLSILCSEDFPGVTNVNFAADSGGSFLGSTYADGWRARCAAWPLGRKLEHDAAIRLPSPALILSGVHDPVTPPRWGEAMRRHFPNNLHVIVPGVAHNVSFSGCVPDLIALFITTGSGSGIDTSCAQDVAWPPFVVSDAGSHP